MPSRISRSAPCEWSTVEAAGSLHDRRGAWATYRRTAVPPYRPSALSRMKLDITKRT